jgi:mono/diheme cytochrome c family protein
MRTYKQRLLLGATAAILLILQTGSALAAKPYDSHIKCEDDKCKVDTYLIRGFRAFSQCQVCHGIDGNGSTIAPSLISKLQEIDEATFVERVTNGFKGQVGVMPPWKTNPNVMKYIDNLYAYLMARSDKIIPAGRLQRFDRDEGGSSAAPKSAPEKPASVASSENMETPASEIPSSSGVFGSRGNLH